MNVLVVHHEATIINKVLDFLKNNDIKYTVKDRECLNNECYLDKDLVIVIGGDGTFLRASHHNKDIPVIGINPQPGKKEGFFMQADVTTYEKILSGLLDKINTVDLLRLQVQINNKQLPVLALNDVFIGDAKPYNMFNYELVIENQREFQRGSGLIIGTPAGSSAWLKSAGGKVMDLEDTRFQFVARDLFEGRLIKGNKLKNGIIDSIKIISRCPGIVVIDSISKEYNIKSGDTVIVSKSKDSLKYVKNIIY